VLSGLQRDAELTRFEGRSLEKLRSVAQIRNAEFGCARRNAQGEATVGVGLRAVLRALLHDRRGHQRLIVLVEHNAPNGESLLGQGGQRRRQQNEEKAESPPKKCVFHTIRFLIRKEF